MVVNIGIPYNALQNEVVALPTTLCQVVTTAACEVSVNGTAWSAFTSDTVTAAPFIRCTTGPVIILAKSAYKEGTQPAGLLFLSLSAAPPPPLPGKIQIYLDKNLAGKFRVRAMFPSGVSANIVVEP